MPKSRLSDKKTEKEMEAILEKALNEPGVAEAVEVYERAEFVATVVAGVTGPSESTANSTIDEPPV